MHTATLYLGARVRQRGQLLPVGITWSFLIIADVVVVLCGAIAALQRPVPDLPVALVACAITVSPILSFAFFNTKFGPVLLGATWSLATALLLFATSTPTHTDLAPALLALMVGTVGSLTSPIGGFLALVAASALLLASSAVHGPDEAALYFGLLAAGWVIGYLAHAQRVQVAERIRAQAASTKPADECQHTALPRMTERLARRATIQIPAEPGIDDIGVLVEDFARRGLAVALSLDGSSQHISREVELALYRTTQEMLANIARHAPHSKSTVALAISPASAQLAINTDPADLVEAATNTRERHCLCWMQQVDSLGGAIEYGPTHDGWSVCVEIPLQDCDSNWSPWWCAPT